MARDPEGVGRALPAATHDACKRTTAGGARPTMRFLLSSFVLVVSSAAAFAAEPATAPALDPALEAKLADIDARAAKIEDFSGKFDQQKFTALLRKPLLSNGTVRKVGSVIRWDTEKPEPSVLFS